jgi:predicted nucleic acid-binding protein
VIYVDTSVVLAHLLAEDRRPPDALWRETLVSSALLEYEAWTRIHARKLAKSHGDALTAVLGRVARIELVAEVLRTARERFPVEVRTLDALHLASMQFLIDQGQPVALATYDRRMLAAAKKLKLGTYPLD